MVLLHLGRMVLVWAGYAAVFALLHEVALLWSSESAFSFWFPAAGLRFALLWWLGLRALLPLLLAELAGYAMLAFAATGGPPGLLGLCGIAVPPVIYALVIALCRRHLRAPAALLNAGTFQLLVASLMAPIAVALAELPLAMARHAQPAIESARDAVRVVAVFALGDVTAVLLLAPPLLWFLNGRGPSLGRLVSSRRNLVEFVLVLGSAWSLTLLGIYAGLGMRLVPVMLAVAWIGLRAGRAAAWLAVALAAAIALPLTADQPSEAESFAVHLGLAATAIIGNLVGAFSDSELRLRAEVAKRNRLLFHADRLRTLRAMSTAIIHEIGQPLSVISIEAKHLAKLAVRPDPKREELADSALLVQRKVLELIELVQRLRRFGEMPHRQGQRIALADLIPQILAIFRLDRAAQGIAVDVSLAPSLFIQAEALELQQALLNLLRNAAQRTSDGRVALRGFHLATGEVRIEVHNATDSASSEAVGMGIGLLVATSIVEAFGGSLIREEDEAHFRVAMTFPEPGRG